MSLVNSRFTGIDDLQLVNKKIDELQGMKNDIQKTAQAKLSGAVDNDLEQNVVHKAAKEIIKNIDAICDTRDTTEAQLKLDTVIGEVGDLQCLGDLRKLLEEKNKITQKVATYEKLATIEATLSGTDVNLETLEQISQGIADIHDKECAQEAIAILEKGLDEKIQSIKATTTKELQEILEEMKWFGANNTNKIVHVEVSKKIVSHLKTIVLLQAIRNKPTYPDSWWALEILLGPVITRFNYHFNTNRDTNKISKPEWSFNFIETFLDENLTFLESLVGVVFSKVQRLAAYEIITCLLHPVREKIKLMMNTLNENVIRFKGDNDSSEKNGRLLSHLVFELSAFDQRLRYKYKYNPYVESLQESPTKKWIGLTGDILISADKNDIGAINWLNFEYNLAMKRFHTEILNSKNAFKIDYDFRTASEHDEFEEIFLKPTYSAYNLIKLFNNLTSHYKTLSIIKYQLRYLSTIQLNMLDRYAEKMKELLKKFDESFYSKLSFGFLPGGINKVPIENSLGDSLKALEQLTEVYCSIVFVKDNLVQWSEDLIFIQLWNAFISFSNKKNIKESSMFDEAFKNYSNLADIVIGKYERFFKHQIKLALKEYVNFGEWSAKMLVDDIEPSNSLSIVLTVVPTYMNLLKKLISHLDYLLIADMVTTFIFKIYYEYIITNNSFNKAGRIQLKTDFEYLVSQLQEPLCLIDSNDLSNINNKDFIKLSQCIDLFSSVDADTTKKYHYNDAKLAQLRSSYTHSLSSLSNHDLNDILQRFV